MTHLLTFHVISSAARNLDPSHSLGMTTGLEHYESLSAREGKGEGI
jgi:hypothetical protein